MKDVSNAILTQGWYAYEKESFHLLEIEKRFFDFFKGKNLIFIVKTMRKKLLHKKLYEWMMTQKTVIQIWIWSLVFKRWFSL